MYLQIEEGVDGFRDQSHDNGRDAREGPDVFPVLGDVPVPPEEDSVGRVASDIPGQPALLALRQVYTWVQGHGLTKSPTNDPWYPDPSRGSTDTPSR